MRRKPLILSSAANNRQLSAGTTSPNPSVEQILQDAGLSRSSGKQWLTFCSPSCGGEKYEVRRSHASTPFHPPYDEMRRVMRDVTAGLLELCVSVAEATGSTSNAAK